MRGLGGGFILAPAFVPDSTEAPYTTLTSRKTAGAMARPKTVRPAMNASESNPGKGNECSDESVDYQAVGAQLLRSEFEGRGDAIRGHLFEFSKKVEQGEEITADDIQQVRHELTEIRLLLNVVEEATE